ncbi:hypothetical protein JKP88DRAFT_236167 [Tribonema minus]|uniref:Uncharacterized protein n=1 Tax=Tribonema minus TaxID=303371 RepID=A0A835Z6F9_9STRA|nr:hypothetical protein JKP88DRAFT_236167 [Tribonema minus]
MLGSRNKDLERVSMKVMKGSTNHGVPEELSMVGIGSMPPPEAGYDISDSIYMENVMRVEKQKRMEKRKEEAEEMAQYRMASSTTSLPKPRLAVATARPDASAAAPDQLTTIVKVKLKRKSSDGGSSSSSKGQDSKKSGEKHSKKKKHKEASKEVDAAPLAVAAAPPLAVAPPMSTPDVEEGGALGLVAYSSGSENDNE